MDIREHLLSLSSKVFDERTSLLSLWQTIADNFYVERADFTVTRNLGTEFADNLMTSYPLLARRDLGNAIGAMLRPSSKEWFHIRTRDNYERLGKEAKAWLEWAERRMARAMRSKGTMFSRATKQGDHDFAAFGQSCLQVTLNRDGTGLLYRCWHLRDVAWIENAAGEADSVFRRWKPKASELVAIFGKQRVHGDVLDKMKENPYCTIEAMHVIVPSEILEHCSDYKPSRTGNKYTSCYIDMTHKHIMEQVELPENEYLIPRWQTVSGSQYAYSPATVAALPDARLIQAMTLVLLEAGEKATNPPLIAVQQAIRGDVSLYSGGITWVDAEYDQKLSEVLRPLNVDKNGIPMGFEMQSDIRGMITEAFFLNKLSLPQPEQEMTAYEVGQRVQEYIRQAMPLFEPMEDEYNGPLCEITFSKMMRAGAFGSPTEIPEELRGAEIEFVFESPLHDAVDRQKGQRFIEASEMLATAAQLDPSAGMVVDATVALRDVLSAIGVPAAWQRSELEVKEIQAQQQQAQEAAQQMAVMQQGADVAKSLSDAGVLPNEEAVAPL